MDLLSNHSFLPDTASVFMWVVAALQKLHLPWCPWAPASTILSEQGRSRVSVLLTACATHLLPDFGYSDPIMSQLHFSHYLPIKHGLIQADNFDL